mmetsp:Transcript_28852/g.82673  ORF Transcript_28852/g.82673 Transcript_28852/m.82673 type:complete len:231 (+) Transcript_28852:3-695(+)
MPVHAASRPPSAAPLRAPSPRRPPLRRLCRLPQLDDELEELEDELPEELEDEDGEAAAAAMAAQRGLFDAPRAAAAGAAPEASAGAASSQEAASSEEGELPRSRLAPRVGCRSAPRSQLLISARISLVAAPLPALPPGRLCATRRESSRQRASMRSAVASTACAWGCRNRAVAPPRPSTLQVPKRSLPRSGDHGGAVTSEAVSCSYSTPVTELVRWRLMRSSTVPSCTST